MGEGGREEGEGGEEIIRAQDIRGKRVYEGKKEGDGIK